MKDYRIKLHPILPIPEREELEFIWRGEKLTGLAGETIASALFAHGIRIFGRHPKDGSPQGIFCANGQCSQCLVLADGKQVKSCMELVQAGMHIEPVIGLPELPRTEQVPEMEPVKNLTTDVLIIGGGPAGLSAAIELGKRGVSVILVDDKHRLGGKLILQTHRFFG